MKVLLDTHVLLWAAGVQARLPQEARELIEDPDTELVFSAASLWEVAIKSGLGRDDSESVDRLPMLTDVLHPSHVVRVGGEHIRALHG